MRKIDSTPDSQPSSRLQFFSGMASKKSISSKHGEGRRDGHQTDVFRVADEELRRVSDDGTDSDTETDEDEATATVKVPPIKPYSAPPRKLPGSEPVEDGSASECSSPSASAFMVVPASRPRERKKPSASTKFTKEEEVALLQGLGVFWANGRNNKWTEFHLFIKDDLPREFTKIQVSEKIRSLKRKFDTNWEKIQANGANLDVLDSHESLLFELSKKLWGDEKGIASEANNEEKIEGRKTPFQGEHRKVVPKIRKTADPESDGGEEKRSLKKQKQMAEIGKEKFVLETEYPLLCSSFDAFGYPKFVKESCYRIGRDKAQELEQKWRELNEEELRLELKKIDLIKRGLLNQHTSR